MAGVLLALFAVLASCSGGAPTSGEGRPNVVLIVVDTLRADAILDPSNLIQTPHIDSLAADGVSFPSAFAHAPMTLPSHTSLFSSRLPFESGVLNNGQEVPTDLPLLAEWLDDYGYDTHAVISLGTLNLSGRNGLDRGFDSYDVDFWRIARASEVAPRLQETVSKLSADDPFFLFAHYSDPHEPYNRYSSPSEVAQVFIDGELVETVTTSEMTIWEHELALEPGSHTVEVTGDISFRIRYFGAHGDGARIPVEWVEGERLKTTELAELAFEVPADTRTTSLKMWICDRPTRPEVLTRYVEEVQFVDRYVGELIADLKRRDLYDSSLILFTSDHGEALGEGRHFGHVQGLDDAQIQVPLIIKPPADHPFAADLEATRERLVRHVDLTPTILEFLGLPPLPGQRGASLFEESNPVLLAETHKPEARQDKVALRDTSFKMTFIVDEDRFEMFDLRSDARERIDVFETRWEERPDWPEQLRAIARQALQRTRKAGDLDPEMERQLEALGYGG